MVIPLFKVSKLFSVKQMNLAFPQPTTRVSQQNEGKNFARLDQKRNICGRKGMSSLVSLQSILTMAESNIGPIRYWSIV